MTNPDRNYGIFQGVIGSTDVLPISRERYESLATAQRTLVEVLSLEEKYDVLVSNLIHLEKAFNDVLLESMIRRRMDYHDVQDDRVQLALHLQNLLAAAKAYLDQGAHHCAGLEHAAPGLRESFKKGTHEKFEKHIEYRVMDALRNHALHRGAAVKGISLAWMKETPPDARPIVRHTIDATIDIDALVSDSSVRSETRKELEDFQGPLNVRPVVRVYVAAISEIHAIVRTRLSTVVESCSAKVHRAISDFQAACPDASTVAIVVGELLPDGRRATRVSLFYELTERVRRMESKNGLLDQLPAWHLTDESAAQLHERTRKFSQYEFALARLRGEFEPDE